MLDGNFVGTNTITNDWSWDITIKFGTTRTINSVYISNSRRDDTSVGHDTMLKSKLCRHYSGDKSGCPNPIGTGT